MIENELSVEDDFKDHALAGQKMTWVTKMLSNKVDIAYNLKCQP